MPEDENPKIIPFPDGDPNVYPDKEKPDTGSHLPHRDNVDSMPSHAHVARFDALKSQLENNINLEKEILLEVPMAEDEQRKLPIVTFYKRDPEWKLKTQDDWRNPPPTVVLIDNTVSTGANIFKIADNIMEKITYSDGIEISTRDLEQFAIDKINERFEANNSDFRIPDLQGND